MPETRRPATGAAVFKPEVTDAITAAAIETLVEVGYARLSMESVARRAGVGKSALYRRWPSKVDLVTAVLAQLSVPTDPPPDTGTLRGDLRAIVQAVADWFTDARLRAILPSLIAEYQRSPALAEASAAHIGEPRRAWARQTLDRAVERDEATPAQAELLLDLLAAPTYWRVLHDRPVDDAYLDELAEMLTRAVGTSPG
ncbi:AcrR family transcriptional regulator [Mycolicibacterium iranicum]|uniref:AcrR family transcriptional regulator n=1 Tax=Mycolicibacterium iranicum TaxID=912594 RepID=A0A839Q146_MYCIR|nr:TetR/AcrR family transcriptional regulator [Mycolicibacterium iranicum]MBB2989153.1 AcrR family transcriptional regulator [Mycolicibacterium iranicum]